MRVRDWFAGGCTRSMNLFAGAGDPWEGTKVAFCSKARRQDLFAEIHSIQPNYSGWMLLTVQGEVKKDIFRKRKNCFEKKKYLKENNQL